MTSSDIERLLARTRRWWVVAFLVAGIGVACSFAGPKSAIGNAGSVLVLAGMLAGLCITVLGIVLTAKLSRSRAG